jgi:RNA polymerase sigma-70 factor (ECF subfamily)
MPDSTQTAEFVRLWMLHGQRIYAYLLTLASNSADADELYQDVGMTLWENFDQFTPGTNFQAWAKKIALNKIRNFRRLRQRETVLCSPQFFDTINERLSEQTTLLDAQHKALADCYRRLPAKHQDLLDRRYQPGATPASVAGQTGRSLKAIYQALRRIHDVLFDCVRQQTLGEELP